MPGWLSIVFLLGFGSVILAIACNGWRKGELPAGSSGWRSYRPNRGDNRNCASVVVLPVVAAASFTISFRPNPLHHPMPPPGAHRA
jgi:hypothetical protein